ncbi:MAG: 3'-5' exonuclease [Proteobacteria bacterium]|nr:3'-5' exonuclease [Pseudomonadota bacterium]
MFNFFKSKKSKQLAESASDPSWELDLPVQEIKAVVVDTELTGLDRKQDSIVSIGAVKMSGGRVEIGQTFYQLVNPRMQMNAEVVIIHEITPAEVLEKPDIGPVLSEFLEFCGKDIVVGHYIALDLAFINRELTATTGRVLENPALDTMSLMHFWRSNTPKQGPECFAPKRFELVEIAKELGIQVQGAHNALMDAFMTAQVFQRLLPKLQALGIKTLGDLLRVGHPDRKIEPLGGMYDSRSQIQQC